MERTWKMQLASCGLCLTLLFGCGWKDEGDWPEIDFTPGTSSSTAPSAPPAAGPNLSPPPVSPPPSPPAPPSPPGSPPPPPSPPAPPGPPAPPSATQQPDYSGYVHKGPFLPGTEVVLKQLDASLNPTGLEETVVVTDPLGGYTVPLAFRSSLVELTATGRFYNEVLDTEPADPLTLGLINDFSNLPFGNINLLTTLSRSRIRHLMGGGMAFENARDQAEAEVKKMFGCYVEFQKFAATDLAREELAPFFLLLASGTLIQKNSVSEITTRIAAIESDLETDGELSDPSLRSNLKQAQNTVNGYGMFLNLYDRYADLGLTIAQQNHSHRYRHFEDGCAPAPMTLFSDTFDSDTGWTLGPESSITGGVLTVGGTVGASAPFLYPPGLKVPAFDPFIFKLTLGNSFVPRDRWTA